MSAYLYPATTKYYEICHDPVFLAFISLWVEKYIKRPIQGFEQKTNMRGERMTKEQMLSKTHDQIIHAACYFYERGRPLNEIISIISSFRK